MSTLVEKTSISFVVDTKGVATECMVVHITKDGEKEAIVLLPGEIFSPSPYSSRKGTTCSAFIF